MNQEIQNYLQQANPDFQTGFSLFCKYSVNQSLMSWIGRKGDMEMLIYELKKLDRSGIATVNINAAVHEAMYNKVAPVQAQAGNDKQNAAGTGNIQFKTYDERRTRRADLPEELQKVYDAISEDYKLRRGLHEKMKQATSDADRASFRARILEVQQRIEEGWKKIDSHLLEAEKQKVADKFSEPNCRAYISKALKSESVSDKVAAGVKIRVQALIDHGCTISEETQAALKAKNLV